MKIISISDGNGWTSRWKHIGMDGVYMNREVIVFAVIGSNTENRLSSFSGPTNNFICPDDEGDPYQGEFPWQFIGWEKPEVSE